MGASIYWKPAGDGTHLDVGLRSRFIGAMSKAFGPYPWRLGPERIPTLYGMKAAWDGQDEAAFERLLSAIDEHGEIVVWPEY